MTGRTLTPCAPTVTALAVETARLGATAAAAAPAPDRILFALCCTAVCAFAVLILAGVNCPLRLCWAPRDVQVSGWSFALAGLVVTPVVVVASVTALALG